MKIGLRKCEEMVSFKENNLKTLHCFFFLLLSFALYDYMENVTRFLLLMIYKVCKIIIFYFLLFF